MERWSILLVLLALAGCITPAANESAVDAVAEAAAPFEPVLLEGTLWLPPSSGNAREETLLDLPANASGLAIHANLAVGSSYGAELPVTTADVIVQIRDAAGEVLAEGALGTAAREAQLSATTVAAGPHVLAILSYGGSDGASMGDHVHYHVEIKAAA